MNSGVIVFIEFLGAVILLIAVGYNFARISGYGESYDKMIYDEESDDYITIQKNKDSDNDINHDSN
jgi:hypothetical protein